MTVRREDEEGRLIERANAGDPAAFAELYEAHRDWVVALARRWVSDRDDALDVLQETFEKFFDRFPGFRLTSTVRGFLFPVVRNTAISLIRRRKKVVALDEARRPQLAWHPAVEGDFERLVVTLPREQQEVIRLRFGLDFKIQEIAATLDLPEGTVKSRLHNSLKSLRSVIDGEEEGEK